MLLDSKGYQQHTSIPSAPSLDFYPLSSSQRRLWILSRFEGSEGAYNIPAVFRLTGDFDVSSLQKSYFGLLSRHEILRTVFRESSTGEAFQLVLPEVLAESFEHLVFDFTSEKAAIDAALSQETGRVFDLSYGPLIRLTILEDRSGDGYIFCLVMHHIISDGWSMDILKRELFTLYNHFKSGRVAVLPPLTLQYKDYAFWEQSELEQSAVHSRVYWQTQLSGDLPLLHLPSKGARPVVKTYNGCHVSGSVSIEILSLLKQLSLDSGGTLFMTVLSAVKVLLYRYSGQKDLIIGTPVAGRDHADLQDQIGFYVNTLALRSRIEGEERFIDFLSSVREMTLSGYSHQSYPFDRLVDDLNVVRDLSRNPVFDVMLSFQDSGDGGTDNSAETLEGVILGSYTDSSYVISKFDLDFSFSETSSGLSIGLGYNTDIYEKSFAEKLLKSLEILLNSICHSPETGIDQLEILGSEYRYLLTEGFNQTALEYPQDKTVLDFFDSQVLLTPDHRALVFEGHELSYRELNERSNQFADYLHMHYSIGREDLVGVQLERSEDLIVTILGILKSGGAYVPIDPSYPSDRIAYMIEDSGCKVNIDSEEYLLFNLDKANYSITSPKANPIPIDLAYVIYTSGSTGHPKGVMVEHEGLMNLLSHVTTAFPLSNQSSGLFPLLASNAFDISLFELFYPLLQGTGVLVLGNEKSKDVGYLKDHLGEMSSLHTVPALMSELLSQVRAMDSHAEYSHIDYIFIGGDKVPTGVLHDIRKTFPNAKIITLYGPTECTIFLLTRSYTGSGDEFKGSLLGGPVSNTQVYILSEGDSLCPVGVVGEICISGVGVARGYLNRPDLTLEKFVSNPFVSGSRMYKTGDLGRWHSDGSIEFLGRKDNQVKIRGYRIELGEIESVLQGHPDITGSVVLAVENGEGQKELAAYLTGSVELRGSDLRDYLRMSLPEYMLPGHYIQLASFPLTSNGKIDRGNLPDAFGSSLGTGTEYVSARNETESKLVTIWEDVLGKSGIGIKDNFFELGGHSLKAARLSALIHQEFNVKISLHLFFELNNIESITQYLTKEQSKKKWLELNLSDNQDDDFVDEVFL
ncbi:amino acid adenylation domain-containing protein [Chryseobacterium antibioticum]|uniref:Amino acid adenylation domain-containing protein n=1 Tax=Chryseobacterium pyrolae TaxID=2987481 RepID=A0ABT2INY8_9FLAO|nr:amino acid adenylation domain-containing protein [Chryseobacterium pyrolae]